MKAIILQVIFLATAIISVFCNVVKTYFQSGNTGSEGSQDAWGPWSDWSHCSAKCGQVAMQVRSRKCQSQPKQWDKQCSGPTVEGRACKGPECPGTGESLSTSPLQLLNMIETSVLFAYHLHFILEMVIAKPMSKGTV